MVVRMILPQISAQELEDVWWRATRRQDICQPKNNFSRLQITLMIDRTLSQEIFELMNNLFLQVSMCFLCESTTDLPACWPIPSTLTMMNCSTS